MSAQTLTIRVLSDLHVEFTGYQPAILPSVGEDLVVLAGDIGVGVHGLRWAQRAFADRQVIYVLGNHEYYDHSFTDLLNQARAVSDVNVQLGLRNLIRSEKRGHNIKTSRFTFGLKALRTSSRIREVLCRGVFRMRHWV